MTLVHNKNGAEIAFEIAEAYMFDDLREQVEEMNPQTKQLFFSLYEILYEIQLGEVCPMSLASPLYAFSATCAA